MLQDPSLKSETALSFSTFLWAQIWLLYMREILQYSGI